MEMDAVKKGLEMKCVEALHFKCQMGHRPFKYDISAAGWWVYDE